jgi:hypothetical protein
MLYEEEIENVGSEQKSVCSIEYEMEHGICGRTMKLGLYEYRDWYYLNKG